MKLSHFSACAVIDYRSRRDELVAGPKPKGLWVSDESQDDSWSKWCEAENYDIAPIEHIVALSPKAELLELTSHDNLVDFTRAYTTEKADPLWSRYYIDWPKVAARYQGILITPYQWSCRLNLSWYYGWDCASGCIWDADAIASVTKVETLEGAQP